MNRRSDVFWDDREYDKPDEPDPRTEKLVRDYEQRTEIIKNQTELLAMILKGMRQ